MAVCSCDVKAVVRDQYFFVDFDSVCGEDGEQKE